MDIKHEIIEPDFTVREFNAFGENYHHWHQRMEIVYIKRGSCTVNIAKKSYCAKSGDIIFIHSGEIHSYASYTEDIIVRIFTFNPSVIQQLKLETVYIQSHITNRMLQTSELSVKAKEIFDEIYEESKLSLHLSDNIIISDLIKLYSLLARHFRNSDMTANKNLSKFEAFQEALEYISCNYMEKITLKDVSDKINYCPAYISTMFISFTGVNFKTYIDTIRIKHAIDLLKKTDKTIAYIAAECGYENLKTFNNTFKRITGISPSELRAENI